MPATSKIPDFADAHPGYELVTQQQATSRAHLRVQRPVAALHLPDRQSAFVEQAVPSGLSAAAFGLQTRAPKSHVPELQSASPAQAAPSAPSVPGELSDRARGLHCRVTELQMPE